MNTNKYSRLGDTAEFLFDAIAVRMGFIVNRPIHAGTIYDRILDINNRFIRVQIKCVTSDNECGGIELRLKRHNNQPYPVDRVDVIAVYAIHRDAWYFFKNKGFPNLYIKKNASKDNWDIFNEKVQDNIQEIQEGLGICRS